MSATKPQKWIDLNLITLKIVLFFTFGGLALLQFLNCLQPLALGLNFDEYRLISIIVPFTSIIGPLIAGPLADRLASRNANKFGVTLRVLTSIFLILTAIIFACSFAIQPVKREKARRPLVSFGCDSDGAIIFQERCTEEKTCFHWKKEKFGNLILTNCSYTCQNPKQFESLYYAWTKSLPIVSSTESSSESDYFEDTSSTVAGREKRAVTSPVSRREVDDRHRHRVGVPDKVYVEPPHLCTKGSDGQIQRCHVYTSDTISLRVQATLRSATNQENETHSAEWCNYPLDGFQCNIPQAQAEWMPRFMNLSSCKPMVECEVLDPYDSPGSVLADSQCIKVEGDIEATYYGYLTLRIFGDIFPLAALTLLQTAVIIATRETSTGRGEVSKQIAWGAIGWILCFPRVDLLYLDLDKHIPNVTYVLIGVILAFVLAAVIYLFSSNIPLSPPEWWWHTKTGMLVYPMSAIRRYGPETFALTLIAIVLGIFWSSIYTYLPWTWYDNGYVTIVAILPIGCIFFEVDKFVEICGHSNVLIGSFAVYIIRLLGLYVGENARWLNILLETWEPLAFGLTWVTVILYMWHIVPRRFTSTGQALTIIAHFCVGKGFGALIGLVQDPEDSDTTICMYRDLTIAACILGIIYFIAYHCLLAPWCVAKSQPPPPITTNQTQPSNGGSPTNGSNGNYTPLRVYHNDRGKKGQFRY